MKYYFMKTLCLLAVILSATSIYASDFNVENEDGVTIHYNIVSEELSTCEVTFQGQNKYSNNNYSGDVKIPSTVTYSSVKYTVTKVGNDAFYGCSGLTSVTIPNSVTSIGENAFYKCEGLTSVGIPNSVNSIGKYAFYYCKTLAEVTLPESITEIMDNTFSSCSKLASITIPNTVTSIGNNAFSGCSSFTSIEIPASVTTIGDFAFGSCKVTEITIPKTVTSIRANPFSGCGKLKSIVVEEGNPNYNSNNGCNAIIETNTHRLVSACDNTVIPSDVKSIGNFAFCGCDAITSLTIPEGVESIGEWAFSSLDHLKSIEMPKSMKSIGKYAFAMCKALTSVYFAPGISHFCEGAFTYCTQLKEVILPKTVTQIDDYAFSECTELTSIISYITDVFATTKRAFENNPNLTLYVQQDLLETYKSTEGWSSISNIEALPVSTLTLSCNDKGTILINGLEEFTNDVEDIDVYSDRENTFVFTPDASCELEDVLIDGKKVTTKVLQNQLTTSISNHSKMVVVFSSKAPGTYNDGHYYDVNGDGSIDISDVVSLVNFILNPIAADVVSYKTCPDSHHPHLIDLGLTSGTKWSCCNVGAEVPEDNGDYFAWGETEGYYSGKRYFYWTDYKFRSDKYENKTFLTKYCTNSEYGVDGFTDNKTELETEDDAAYVNWGSDWRMPSTEQCTELQKECTWVWTTQNGVTGKLGTGPNGGTIFIPASGSINIGSDPEEDGRASFWSRTLDPYHSLEAWSAGFLSTNNFRGGWDRYIGLSVRPVSSR